MTFQDLTVNSMAAEMIGRLFDGSEALVPLGTVTIVSMSGSAPDVKDKLNNLASDGAILDVVFFSILIEIPSWPLALEGLRFTKELCTSSSEHKKKVIMTSKYYRCPLGVTGG